MILLLILSISIALILMAVGSIRLLKYRGLESWVKQVGTIIHIEEKYESVPQQYYNLKYLYPAIKYKYLFNGSEYVSTSVSPHIRNIWLCEIDNFGTPLDNKSKFWHGWQKGNEIDIYVNSKAPKEAYIINRQSKLNRSHNFAILLGGIIVFAISTILAIYT